MVFPEPDAPTSAVTVRGATVNETPSRTTSPEPPRPGYPKRTPSTSTAPGTATAAERSGSGSGGSSSTARTRPMSLRAIRTTPAKSPTSASGPANRATSASSATSSTGSTAPRSASDAPTPISTEKHTCTAKPPSSIPGTDIHTCLRTAARCLSSAASSGA